MQSDWSLSGDSPVLGSVGETQFKIHTPSPPLVRNSFKTYLYGHVAPLPNGTQVTCRIGLARAVTVFMVFWFAFLVVFIVVAAGANLSGTKDARALFMLVLPFGMACFGVGLVWIGRRKARAERPFLLDFLRETIKAQAVSPPASGAIEARRR